MELRKGTVRELDAAMALIDQAKAFLRAQGVDQWQSGYPDRDNRVMRHLLEKNGFTYCGTIRFDNSEKIAFEKVL